jgi:hypothetical protein
MKVTATLDNSKAFDAWLGRYLTTPLRMQVREYRAFFLKSYQGPTEKRVVQDDGNNGYDDEEGDDYDDDALPISVAGRWSRASQQIFDSAEDVLVACLQGKIKLRRAEGAKLAYIADSMYIDGEVHLASSSRIAYTMQLHTLEHMIACEHSFT